MTLTPKQIEEVKLNLPKQILLALSRHPMNPKGISKATGLPSAAVKASLTRLTFLGLVQSQSDLTYKVTIPHTELVTLLQG